MTLQKSHIHALSGILLITGTCVGAGMLALPVVTAPSGFYPAMLVNLLCWLFMMATGLLFLEATLWMEDGANVLSMAGRFLGPVGKWTGGIAFLFLYYCLMVSYLSGGSPLFGTIAQHALNLSWNSSIGFWLFAFIFGAIVFIGAKGVDRVNWILMFGLVFSYLLLLIVGSSEVQMTLLKRSNWAISLAAAPTFFSAYGYHNVVPSIATYLQRNKRNLRLAIIIGTTIPFVVYSLWLWIIMGSIPAEILNQADLEGIPVSQALQDITGHQWVSTLGTYFGFFALVTSLLGVSLSMVDFMGDGLKVKRTGLSRLMLCLLVFFPPALFTAIKPGIFIEAIGIAGGIGEAILNGLLPVTLVWIGRYRLGLEREDQLPGGKFVLVILFAFALWIMGLECAHLIKQA